MEQVGHIGDDDRIDIQAELIHARTLLVEREALVPVMEQAGHTGLALVHAVYERHFLGGRGNALAMLVTLFGNALLQKLLHALVVLVTVNVFHGH